MGFNSAFKGLSDRTLRCLEWRRRWYPPGSTW